MCVCVCGNLNVVKMCGCCCVCYYTCSFVLQLCICSCFRSISLCSPFPPSPTSLMLLLAVAPLSRVSAVVVPTGPFLPPLSRACIFHSGVHFPAPAFKKREEKNLSVLRARFPSFPLLLSFQADISHNLGKRKCETRDKCYSSLSLR